MPIDVTTSGINPTHFTSQNVDNSFNVTTNTGPRYRVDARRYTTTRAGPVTLGPLSVNLHSDEYDRAELAELRAKKRKPRLPLGTNDLLLCVKVKLDQTVIRLELLQKIGCPTPVCEALHSQLDDYQQEYHTVLTTDSGWNPTRVVGHLSRILELKATVKELYARTVRTSEDTRINNTKQMNLTRAQFDFKASPCKFGPEWIEVIEAARDIDDDPDTEVDDYDV
ncbi:hypothetical protein ONZ45_g8611 [Pleurotus djamor]|nr:hypothetical protein ONZ45_g8611 [Pleurotus djamor]